jgi:hypothetical protein
LRELGKKWERSANGLRQIGTGLVQRHHPPHAGRHDELHRLDAATNPPRVPLA